MSTVRFGPGPPGSDHVTDGDQGRPPMAAAAAGAPPSFAAVSSKGKIGDIKLKANMNDILDVISLP